MSVCLSICVWTSQRPMIIHWREKSLFKIETKYLLPFTVISFIENVYQLLTAGEVRHLAWTSWIVFCRSNNFPVLKTFWVLLITCKCIICTPGLWWSFESHTGLMLLIFSIGGGRAINLLKLAHFIPEKYSSEIKYKNLDSYS